MNLPKSLTSVGIKLVTGRTGIIAVLAVAFVFISITVMDNAFVLLAKEGDDDDTSTRQPDHVQDGPPGENGVTVKDAVQMVSQPLPMKVEDAAQISSLPGNNNPPPEEEPGVDGSNDGAIAAQIVSLPGNYNPDPPSGAEPHDDSSNNDQNDDDENVAGIVAQNAQSGNNNPDDDENDGAYMRPEQAAVQGNNNPDDDENAGAIAAEQVSSSNADAARAGHEAAEQGNNNSDDDEKPVIK